jgi:uncharacterized protein affecting Mg2+/Co2+ transport
LIFFRNIKLKKYVKVTNNVRVSVIPIYLGQGFIRDRRVSGESFSRNDFIKSRHYWQYHITIENLSNEPLELIERLWYIYEDNENEEGDSNEGSLKRVAGRGVVGKHPILFNETQPFKVEFHLSSLFYLLLVHIDIGHLNWQGTHVGQVYLRKSSRWTARGSFRAQI